MTGPSLEDIFAALDATWPPHRHVQDPPWTLREGAGGGKRVSAATAAGPVEKTDLAHAEVGMAALGQTPLVMVRDGEVALDQQLAAANYQLVDPVEVWLSKAAALAAPLPPLTGFTIWPPLGVMDEIWEDGGIGPARRAIMHRAAPPKTGLFARTSDQPAGAGFVAMHKKIAMVHALEVRSALRRQKAAVYMMRAAANWAQAMGATWLAVLVTEANEPARALYGSLGLRVVGHYHYREKSRFKAERVSDGT